MALPARLPTKSKNSSPGTVSDHLALGSRSVEMNADRFAEKLAEVRRTNALKIQKRLRLTTI
jgi:hypothetical protein